MGRPFRAALFSCRRTGLLTICYCRPETADFRHSDFPSDLPPELAEFFRKRGIFHFIFCRFQGKNGFRTKFVRNFVRPFPYKILRFPPLPPIFQRKQSTVPGYVHTRQAKEHQRLIYIIFIFLFPFSGHLIKKWDFFVLSYGTDITH